MKQPAEEDVLLGVIISQSMNHGRLKFSKITRFTDLETQLKHLYCGDDLTNYKDYWIKPVGQIDRSLILEEWHPKRKQIILTLASKETTQSKIIRKLCTYKQNRTLKAIFELDKIERSIYTLKYLTDSKLQQYVHRSQNRIESYHQLRAAIALPLTVNALSSGTTPLLYQHSKRPSHMFWMH